MNSIQLIGRLTTKPDLRLTKGGTATCTVRLAVPRRRRKGEAEAAPVYVNVVTYGAQAEAVAQYLDKGRRVSVAGRLEHREWTTDDGRHSIHEVVASQVEFLDAAPRTPQTPRVTSPPTPPVRSPSSPSRLHQRNAKSRPRSARGRRHPAKASTTPSPPLSKAVFVSERAEVPVVALTANGDGHGDARHRTNPSSRRPQRTASRQSACQAVGPLVNGIRTEPRPIPCRRLPGWCLYRRLGSTTCSD